MQREFGLVLLFISHGLSVVRHISHRVMVLYLGRVIELAARERIYDQPRHPYTKALISAVALPDPDREQKRARIVLAGDLPSPIDRPPGCPFRTRCPKATDLFAQVAPPLEETDGHWTACHHWRE